MIGNTGKGADDCNSLVNWWLKLKINSNLVTSVTVVVLGVSGDRDFIGNRNWNWLVFFVNNWLKFLENAVVRRVSQGRSKRARADNGQREREMQLCNLGSAVGESEFGDARESADG